MQSIDAIERYQYGARKDLVGGKEVTNVNLIKGYKNA